ncbi:hypothetical protein LPB72_21825 [Hydrogenophaga crassostreae]|uniref:Pilus assembly protein n=1 Tax=Hydrogenophaga crassostreae TaxID=1763535 RepID=A0A167GBZ5_9BURK|nr:hypothetical protein [Hydrogenophaga crassostreae]AOW15153.1 hypothetical protein LPB072_22440 [Hydrogenophaga crassostreae]OAD39243.1 hypothetical protein LPB72_21825 [Hydrogenophaga crassostreae]
MSFNLRMRAASKAALFHFLASAGVAAMAAVLVFLVWYPHPYGLLSGGLKLFLILVTVDVVCGPLLTLVLYSPKKPRREILIDMSLVILIQLGALVYGMHTVHQARPLFLVHEVDRFRVISMPDYNGDDVHKELGALPLAIRPRWTGGPVVVGIRDSINSEERKEVMVESVFGGRDYSQRPEFYIPYDETYKPKALSRTKPLQSFVDRFPETGTAAVELLTRAKVGIEQAKFLPVMHKQEWVAVMDGEAKIVGFLPGDGFAVP